jgi:hypothetical protein
MHVRRIVIVVSAVVVSVTLAVGSVFMLAGAADAAGAGSAAVSPAASASWKIQATPNPAGSEGNSLEGVSCPSASSCMAAGVYDAASGGSPTLGEQWNGTTWTIHAGPSVTSVNGVSCTSASACTAVGNILTSTMAERWNGKSWTIQATPNPKGAGASQLNAVSCASATACTAVGYYYNTSGVQFPLAEAWNGTTWTIHTAPKPSGSTDPELEGVSCAPASACTAAGGYQDLSTGNYRTFAERWNGTSWTIQTTTNPGAESNYLYAASCASASACTAVGYQQLSSGRLVTLAERWNGTSWATQTTANPAGGAAVLSGVSCASATACTAAGYYSPSNAEPTAPFAEGWNGTTWTLQIPPTPATDDSPLNGVSCTAASTCTAVGQYQDSSGTYLTLAERQ